MDVSLKPFAYVYPPNEPAAIAEWVGAELVAAGMAVSVLSHQSNFSEVLAVCQRAEAVIFHGGLTQLSWLFDTPEKVSAWHLEIRKPRVAISTEMLFCEPPQHGTFRKRAHQSMRVMTHLVGLNDSPALDGENFRLRQTGAPLLVMPAVAFAFSRYTNTTPWAQRQARYCFLGTWHGIQRQVFLRELVRESLVDILNIPKSDPLEAIAAFNRYQGVISLRGNHGVAVPFMPRLMEGAACGCFVCDLQDLEPGQWSQAVARVRDTDWAAAEQLVAGHLASVKQFSPVPYFSAVTSWLKEHPYAG